MKTYIRPYTYCLHIAASSQILAGSGGLNNVPESGNPYIGGNSQESTDNGDNNGNVSEMSKKHNFNAWTTWDD